MDIRLIDIGQEREALLPLLLEADPDERMVRRYLQRGLLLTAVDGAETVGALLAIPQPSGGWEIKNLAVAPPWREKGVGRSLLAALEEQLPHGATLWVGTSETGITYYRRRGFRYAYTLKNFFTAHYPAPIYEDGVQCVDMHYLSKQVEHMQPAETAGA